MDNPTYHLDNPQTDIYVGDCRKILTSLPTGSVGLIFADPPFNWNVPYGQWNDSMPWQEYLGFTRQWLDGSLGTLAPNGSIWVNCPDHIAAEIVLQLKQRKLEM